jgi:hypothetical protein
MLREEPRREGELLACERALTSLVAPEPASAGLPPPYGQVSATPAAADIAQLEMSEPLARSVLRRLVECAGRLELTLAQLGTGGMSRQDAATVVLVELRSLEGIAHGARVAPVAARLRAMRRLARELGVAPTRRVDEPRRVVVIGEEASACERLAVAVESLGHTARSMTSLGEMSERTILPPPDVFFVSVLSAGHNRLPRDAVYELTRTGAARVIAFTTAPDISLDVVARACGARCCVCVATDGAVGPLAARLAQILQDVAS